MKIDLAYIPETPGVYLYYNNKNEIIYIGKAKNLKKRVSSYFDRNQKDFKTTIMTGQIERLEYISTRTDGEAFLLENNLIKKHSPFYNIRLKDSKSYPFLAVDFNTSFPRIYKTRETHREGVRYFGPYAYIQTIQSAMKIAHKYFHLRSCGCKISFSSDKSKSAAKACLYYHIGNCPGYCLLTLPEEDYLMNLNRFMRFLNGSYKELVRELKNDMQRHSAALEFEKAAELRDLIQNIEEIKDRQKVYLDDDSDLDVFGCFADEAVIYFTVLFFREGRLFGKRVFKSERQLGLETALSETIARFYSESPVPPLIVVPFALEDAEELETSIFEAVQSKTSILNKIRGEKQSLIKMANDNARYEFLTEHKLTNKELVIKKLKEVLDLPREPFRIEGYDIATIEGHWSVGAEVSFFNGKPDKKNYRHFKIKYTQGQDDYAMLQETLSRRLSHQDTHPLPDLFLIDGGRGQLNAALEVLVDHNIRVPIVSLAKKEELIFIPYRKEPVKLDLTDPSLQLLTSIRDEVHRFANVLHKKIRKTGLLRSGVQNIRGIGEKRRKALLSHFGSLKQLKEASLADIMRVGRISEKLARQLKEK